MSLSYLSVDEVTVWPSSRYRCTQSLRLVGALRVAAGLLLRQPRLRVQVRLQVDLDDACRRVSSMVTTARSCVDFGSRSRATHCRVAASYVAVQRASGWPLTVVCTRCCDVGDAGDGLEAQVRGASARGAPGAE